MCASRRPGPIRPTIDGEVTSYFEWLGAGLYQVDERSGSMHGKKFLVKEVLFGSDGTHLFVRVDFRPGVEADLAGMEARITVQSLDSSSAAARHDPLRRRRGVHGRCGGVRVPPGSGDGLRPGADRREGRASGVRFQLSLWAAGLPVDAVPQQGWLEMHTTDRQEMAG